MKPLKTLFAGLMLAAALSTLPLFQTGCGTSQGRYDRPSMTYQTNVQADVVVVTAEQVRSQALDTLGLLWSVERQFRSEAWKLSPEIKKYADYTRAHAKEWLNSLTTLRNQYQLDRTPENKIKLEGAMDLLRKIADEAQLYITKANALKPPTQ